MSFYNFLQYCLWALITYFIYQLFSTKKSVKNLFNESFIHHIIRNSTTIEKECLNICNALSNETIVKDEKECASQLRNIIQKQYLKYSILESNPEYLLRCNRHICDSDHGALATRFTVQYNLYAGSIIALGNDTQKQRLYDTQETGDLGCFAFTEIGAGVLSGAGVETTAEYDAIRKVFVINSPTHTSHKTWISQGMFAEHAVILANVIMPNLDEKERNKGPHLFFTRIQNRNSLTGDMTPINSSIKLHSLPPKTALWGLDNARIEFHNFEVPRTDLLSRFSRVEDDGTYTLNLPPGNKRMLDLLLSRLLTGRVCLSEYTIGVARSILRSSYEYVSSRELWQGSKQKAAGARKDLMIEKPLIMNTFADYSASLAIVAHYIAHTRERVGDCIRKSLFPTDVIEAVCICKFVGTSFGVDAISAIRKTLGSRALLEESRLGPSSFVANATCAAEGDNTIMELKIVGDFVKGGFRSMFPKDLLIRSLKQSTTRFLVFRYIVLVCWAMILGKSAINEGQLIRDIAWCRANLLIMDVWFTSPPIYENEQPNIERIAHSYERVLMRYPAPVCH